MPPKCCKECKHLDPKGDCANHKGCGKWLNWFRREWQSIRKAAALIIERREYKHDKLEELRQELREEYEEGKK